MNQVATQTEVRRPPMRYHGGKWLLAPWIIGHFPAHRTYVEPYGGGAFVLMRKPRSYSEVYNDAWADVVNDTNVKLALLIISPVFVEDNKWRFSDGDIRFSAAIEDEEFLRRVDQGESFAKDEYLIVDCHIVNVFRVIRDNGKHLAELLSLTPFSRDEFVLTSDRSDDPIEQARRTIFRSMAGFGSAAVNGKYATGFRANSSRSGTTPALDWRNYPGCVPAFVDRMRGVVIENKDAWEVMLQHDSEVTLHYVDPPYMHETRNMARGNAAYKMELSVEDHDVLLERLQELAGAVIVSGYRTDLYDERLSTWSRVDRAAKADGARDRIESLWLNPVAAKHGQQRMDL